MKSTARVTSQCDFMIISGRSVLVLMYTPFDVFVVVLPLSPQG